VKLEKDLMVQLKNRLGVLRQTGEVINFHRLNSGTVQNKLTNSWLKLGEDGDLDYISLIRNKDNGITILYIECKSDTGKLRDSQKEFIRRHGNKPDVFIMILRNILEFDKWMGKRGRPKLPENK